MRKGGENCLKYLKRGYNRKEGRGNKDFKKGGASAGSRGMCFKKEGGGGWKPLTNYEEGKCNPSYSLTCKVVSQILLLSSEFGKFGSALLDSFLTFIVALMTLIMKAWHFGKKGLRFHCNISWPYANVLLKRKIR